MYDYVARNAYCTVSLCKIELIARKVRMTLVYHECVGLLQTAAGPVIPTDTTHERHTQDAGQLPVGTGHAH